MKKLKVHQTHDEAAKAILEEGFERSPEERIEWLLKQNKLMQSLHRSSRKTKGLALKKSHG